MKIKSEQVYTVEFTEEQFGVIRDLLLNLNEVHIEALGCHQGRQQEIMYGILEMRKSLSRYRGSLK